MTGDEVRGTKFGWVAKGYPPLAVNEWLADVATCLDAGVPPVALVPAPSFRRGRLRGYDTIAVDQLMSALGFGVPSEPPVLRRIHPTAQHKADWEAERLRVAGLTGTRLLWKWGGWGSLGDVKVLDSGGQVLVARRDRKLIVAASGQVLRWFCKLGSVPAVGLRRSPAAEVIVSQDRS
jgi:hypothetical protein